MQYFKSIYFKDYLANEKESSSLTLSFSETDKEIYDRISCLPSSKIRELLSTNSYKELVRLAKDEGLTVSRYCVWRLKKEILSLNENQQLGLFAIDSKYVNFSTSKGTPFQSWYPYLEGYSPEFVSGIYDRYFKKGDTIYDPFSGTGTTPFTIANQQIQSYYSEVNPLLRYLTDVKVKARMVDNKRMLIKDLNLIIDKFESSARSEKEDPRLLKAYRSTFDKSKFFDDKVFSDLLKIKSAIRKISIENLLVGDLMNIAVISNIVKCSMLKRQGDLRFKTSLEIKKTKDINLFNEVRSTLQLMINDINYDTNLIVKPIQITEDARNISQINSLHFDGVITSPPYLNGTNYFRNTKLELWFLDYLTSKSDLRNFRDLAITAGINDVKLNRETVCVHDSLNNLLKELEEHAYDRRIPKMINDYFFDMKEVFEGIYSRLTAKGRVAIDIGDSIYSDIYIPTHEILTNILEDIGFKLIDEIVLRKRISKNGKELGQILLIYEKLETSHTQKVKTFHWSEKWENFKNDLPHQKLPFSKRNWGNSMHSLCSYQGKLKPSLAYNLVKIFGNTGGKILDPFVGVGTIPFEGALSGITSYGFDISPTAEIISRAKVSRLNPKIVEKVILELEDFLRGNNATEVEIEETKLFGMNKKIFDYYHEDTLKEILLARRYFQASDKLDPHISYIMSCVMHILHGNRPYALSRRSHGITPFAPTGEFIYKNLIQKVREKAYRNLPLFDEKFVDGKIFFQDATKPWPSEIQELDSIITSPPFFDSTRFYSANWLRLWFAGWSSDMFKSEPLNFIDELQKQSFSIYDSIFMQSKERLKKNGVLVMHLGKSKKCNMAQALSEKAKPWFETYDIFEENVEKCESHGIKDKGTVVEHQYLVLV